MPRIIWDGAGQMPEDAVYFTLDNGELKGRRYVRRRVVQALSVWRQGAEPRVNTAAVVRDTVDSDAWLAPQNGCTVGSVCRSAERFMLANFSDYYYRKV